MSQRLATALRVLCRWSRAETTATPDAQLLTRFVDHRDETAFAELVRRHGPMVLSVSRRILRDEHAAEDAFQVTFLALACRAQSVRHGQALSAWLHRVAYHVALRSRAKMQRTATIEKEAMLSRPEPTREIRSELTSVLDDELQRLPEQYRGPLVLCGLEGKTHEDAARELGWPPGSLSKRLARGRELLRERLARRGFTLGSAALLSGDVVSVPESLLTATVQMKGLSANTVALLKEVLRAMMWTRVKNLAVVVLTIGVIASAIGLGVFAADRFNAPSDTTPERPTLIENRGDEKKPEPTTVAFGEKKYRFRNPVLAVAYSPDGKWLSLVGYNTVYLLDATTRKQVRSWAAPKDYVMNWIAFSPDSKSLVVTNGSGPHFHLWDVATGNLIREFKGFPRGTQGLVFSPDGKHLAGIGLDERFGDDKEGNGRGGPAVRIWETATGKELKGFGDGADNPASCVAYSPDGELIAWGAHDGSVQVRKVSGAEVFTYKDKEVPSLPVYSIAISPDSKVLAVGIGALIKLFDIHTGKELKMIGEQQKRDIPSLLVGMRLRYSPDGKTLGSLTSTNLVMIWDTSTGKLSQRYTVPAQVHDMTYSRDGKTVATGGYDHTVRFYDLVNEKEEIEPGHYAGVSNVAISPDGKIVMTGNYREGVRVWDRATGKQLRELPKIQVSNLAYGPAGAIILGIEEDRIHLYDPTTGKDKGTIGKRMLTPSWTAVSPDGTLLAVGGDEIRVYELATGKEKVKLAGHEKCVGMAFSADNKTLISAGEETPVMFNGLRLQFTLRLWDLGTGKEIRKLPHLIDLGIQHVGYSSDGKYCVTNTHAWDVATGKMVKELVPGVQVPIFSPDSKLLALPYQYVIPKSKGVIELWDTTSWEKVGELEGHTGMINAVSFSADGKYIVSGSEDTSARVWALPERKK